VPGSTPCASESKGTLVLSQLVCLAPPTTAPVSGAPSQSRSAPARACTHTSPGSPRAPQRQQGRPAPLLLLLQAVSPELRDCTARKRQSHTHARTHKASVWHTGSRPYVPCEMLRRRRWRTAWRYTVPTRPRLAAAVGAPAAPPGGVRHPQRPCSGCGRLMHDNCCVEAKGPTTELISTSRRLIQRLCALVCVATAAAGA
jgi:hypothetical protein